MRIEIIYPYICRGSEPSHPVDFNTPHQRFADTYRKFRPAIPHVLRVVCYNGVRSAAAEKMFADLNVEWSQYMGEGFDMGCAQSIGVNLDCDFIVGLSSQVHFHREGWLERLAGAFEKHGEGLYGAMGSLENSPHLRGPCMAMPPSLLRQYPHAIDSRANCHRAESGDRNFTQWVRSQNKPTMMVTWDEILPQEAWRTPQNVFRRGDQSNCIVHDRHTLVWQNASPADKAALARSADGLNNPHPVAARPKRKGPPSITIVAVTSLAPKSHWEAIERTAACIPHRCKKLLIAPSLVNNLNPVKVSLGGDSWIHIPDWMPNGQWSIADMCRFLMRGLHEHIETEHAILVQWDGYAINARKWDDRFLDYDFIGAPWPRHFPFVRAHPRRRVGNGGFSLRSKRWLEASAALPDPPKHMLASEDVYSSVTHADHYERAGCRVAPLDVAMRWSLEHRIEEHPRWRLADSFGFHGLTDKDPMRKKLRLNQYE